MRGLITIYCKAMRTTGEKKSVQAPSAVNQQPWAFAVFQGKDKLKSFSDYAKPHFAETLEVHSPAELRRTLTDTDLTADGAATFARTNCGK